MATVLSRFVNALKAFKVVLRGHKDALGQLEGLVDAPPTDTNAELPPLSLHDVGYFVGDIPLHDQSFNAWKRLPLADKIQRNADHLQNAVIKWDDLVQDPLALNVAKYHYVFLHIPKAGGTTLEHVISKNYLPNQFVHANDPVVEKNPSIIFHIGRQHPRSMMMGHYHRSSVLYQFLGSRPIVHFTMFRDPVKRAISYFNYIKTRANHALYEEAKDWTIEDYAQSSIKELQNKQTLRILGDFSETTSQRSLDNPEPLLKEAKQVLLEQFSLFGLTERYTEFLLMTKKLLGWNNIVYVRKNASKRNQRSAEIIKSSTSTISESAMQMIRDRNQLDLALYQFANGLFSERCEKLGIDAAMVAEYDQLNAAYQTTLAELESL